MWTRDVRPNHRQVQTVQTVNCTKRTKYYLVNSKFRLVVESKVQCDEIQPALSMAVSPLGNAYLVLATPRPPRCLKMFAKTNGDDGRLG